IYYSFKGTLEFRDEPRVNPTERAFANLIGREDTAFYDPLFQRFQIRFEDSFDRGDTPHFWLCTHTDGPVGARDSSERFIEADLLVVFVLLTSGTTGLRTAGLTAAATRA